MTDELRCDPCNGDVYTFMNKARNRIKLLHWEPGGLVLYCRLLESGTFGVLSGLEKDAVSGRIEWSGLVMVVDGIIEQSDRIIAGEIIKLVELDAKRHRKTKG